MAQDNIPAQAQKELDAAEAELKQAQAEAAQGDAEAEGGTTEPEAPAAPEPETPEAKPEAQPEPEPKPEPVPQAGVIQPDMTSELTKLRAQHAVLQGKYNAEVPKMAQERRKLKEQIKALEAEVARKTIEEPLDTEKLGLTDAEKELGPEFLSAAQKIAKAMVARAVKPEPQPEPEDTEPAAETPEAAAPTMEQAFWSRFAVGVPDWESINTNAKFAAWLDGTGRRALLQRAQANGDPEKAIEIFNTFKDSEKPKPPNPSLKSQVMPGTRSQQQTTASPKMMAMDEYEREMDKAARLPNPRRDERLRELDQAVREGRVRA